MKTTRHFLLVTAASVVLGVCLPAQTQMRLQSVIKRLPDSGATGAAQQTNCAGTVTDAAGYPVAGATVEYWRYTGLSSAQNEPELSRQLTTGTNGAFEFQVSRAAGFLLVRKPGLAPAWKQLGMPFNSPPGAEEKLVLGPPGTFAGVVVDEANNPVAGAEVFVATAFCEISLESGARFISSFGGKPAHDCFSTRTDAAGSFRIEGFPTNASAFLAVQSPGKVLRQTDQESMGPNSGYRTGQDGLKLVVEPAASVEGKIIGGESNQPPPVARLTLRTDGRGHFGAGEREPVSSGADGAFQINDVAAGAYQLHAVFGTNALPDWVAEAVPVSVEAGQALRGVTLKAVRGGLLEVTVLGKNDHKPQAKVGISAYKENFQSATASDSNGLAVLRLPPGDYQLYASRGQPGVPQQLSASVEAGRTNRAEMELAGPQRITGVVRGSDGRPAAGLPVQLVGAFGPATANVKTDDNGRFEIEWSRQRFGQNDSVTCLLVRDVEHNLAVAQDIDEETGPLDLKLEPGLTLAGRAECDGKPVTNAAGTLIFWTGRSGMHLSGLSRGTNTPGQFEIPALPPGRKYGVLISAPGYGQKSTYDVSASADAGRQELEPAELLPANLKLAGQVLDADDKPVAGVHVNLYGENQPSGNTQTDREGQFRFEHVCDGRVQLSASGRNGYGNASAEGGDTNVVLRLGETYGGSPASAPHKLKGKVTDPDGKPVAGAQVAVFPAGGPRWSRTGDNGTFNLTWSLESWQLQSGGPLLVVRDPVHHLAAVEDLSEEITNLDAQLKPALTVGGLVKNADDSPLPGAQVGVWIKAGNSYEQLIEPLASADAQGRYEIKCLPRDAQCIAFVSAKGHGRSQQPIQPDLETNRLELAPFVLKLADRIVAGQVLNENDKPVSGVNVSLNGEDQPNGNVVTDSKGRFRFQVCEGQVRLYASSQNSYAQAAAEAGDTNVVLTLSSRSGDAISIPRRAGLKGGLLPDLTAVNLAADAAPAQKPVLLCLFDAGQRPSRHVLRQLNEQAAALRQKGVVLLGVQAAAIDDDPFNAWKAAGPVSFPIGRVTEKSEKSKWAANVTALPWLILADANHKVIAEGFPLDELDAQLKALTK
jgi:protocatechuate 3,4-dioxygenase beta subunit